jgi:hypothetical protein
MKIKLSTNDQLEMTFNSGVRCSSANRRQQRLQRAAAWFQRMRQVVERAVDRAPAPHPPPEQIWLPNPPLAAPRRRPSQQQHLAE